MLSRRVGGVICYDALYSRGLKQYLDTQPHQPLPVTYLVTRRFGRPIFYQLVRVGTYSDAIEADSGLTRVSPRDAYMSWPRGCE